MTGCWALLWSACRGLPDADLIAAGLLLLVQERELLAASRLFLCEMENCIVQHEDFAFETTRAGCSYLRLVFEQQGDVCNLIRDLHHHHLLNGAVA